MIIAEEYLTQIVSAFKFAEKRSYCQVATVSQNHLPKSRTILLYYDDADNRLYFTCNTQTQKWAQLTATPKICGIYLDNENLTQYRFEADVSLIDSTSVEEKTFYANTWYNLRPDLRQVLWQEYLTGRKINFTIEEIFPYHGIVIVSPYYWDIFKLDRTDFDNSMRVQMRLADSQWKIFANAPKIIPLNLT